MYTFSMFAYTNRIPAIIFNDLCDEFLAFCEARKESFHDWGSMDMVLRRGKLDKESGHIHWGDIEVVASLPGFRLVYRLSQKNMLKWMPQFLLRWKHKYTLQGQFACHAESRAIWRVLLAAFCDGDTQIWPCILHFCFL